MKKNNYHHFARLNSKAKVKLSLVFSAFLKVFYFFIQNLKVGMTFIDQNYLILFYNLILETGNSSTASYYSQKGISL